jgi:hypothetical protein
VTTGFGAEENSVFTSRPKELTVRECVEALRPLATINSRIAKVVIDGVERTQLDLAQEKQVEIRRQTGANLIEIRGEDECGDFFWRLNSFRTSRTS